MPAAETLERFIAMVESNAHVEAIEAFYREDASMQENNAEPRRGRENLVANERRALAASRSVESRCIRPVFVNGDEVVVHWWFRFVRHDGSVIEIDELAWQRWDGERIVEERFFYDPAQLRPRPAAQGA
jgi:hypothetical protein